LNAAVGRISLVRPTVHISLIELAYDKTKKPGVSPGLPSATVLPSGSTEEHPPGVPRIERRHTAGANIGLSVERGHFVADAGHDVLIAVVIEIEHIDANTRAAARGVGHEAAELPAILAIVDREPAIAVAAHAGNDFGFAVAIEVAAGNEHAAMKQRIVSKELAIHRAVGAAEDADVRPAGQAGSGNDVGFAVAIDISDGNSGATKYIAS